MGRGVEDAAPYEIMIYRLSNCSRFVCDMAIVSQNITPNTCLPLSREGDHEVVEGEYGFKVNSVWSGRPKGAPTKVSGDFIVR